jgi:hypothetical protein
MDLTAAPLELGRVEGFADLPRLEPEPPASERRDLHTVDPGLGPELARREADRCLRCDLRLGYRMPPRPPARETRLPLDESGLERVAQREGVARFYNAGGELLEIIGGPDMRALVAERIGAARAAAFDFEACPMYTQRQNELLSHYMEAHGRMPPGVREEDDLNDLF